MPISGQNSDRTTSAGDGKSGRAVRLALALLLLLTILSSSQIRSEEAPAVYVAPITNLQFGSEVLLVQQQPKKDVAEPKKGAPEAKSKDAPEAKKDQPNDDAAAQNQDQFAQAPNQSREAPEGRNTRMIGDFPGTFTYQTLTVTTTQTLQTFQNVTQYHPVTQPGSTSTQNVSVTLPAKNAYAVVTVEGEGSLAFAHFPATTITVPVTTTNTVTTQVPTTNRVPVTIQVPTTTQTIIVLPQASRGPFQISENESSQPEDRVYFTNNYYTGLQGPSGAPFSSTSTQNLTYNGAPAVGTTTTPGVPTPQFNVNLQVLGIEKIVLDGVTSIGVRVPFLEQVAADGDYGSASVGDVSIVLKHMFFGELTGNLLSGGLVVTVPTGPAIDTYDGTFRDVLVQPFVGGRYGTDRLVSQAFLSVSVPTDMRDVILLFNDYSICYTAYRGNQRDFISSITPTVEAHLTTSLDHTSGTNPIEVPTLLALTAGAHIGIRERTSLTLALSTPVTGPRLYNVEAMAFLNYNY